MLVKGVPGFNADLGKLSFISPMKRFKSNYLVSTEYPEIIQWNHFISEPLLESLMQPTTNKSQVTIDSTTQWISILELESLEKDNKTKLLTSEVAQLKIIRVDLLQLGLNRPCEDFRPSRIGFRLSLSKGAGSLQLKKWRLLSSCMR